MTTYKNKELNKSEAAKGMIDRQQHLGRNRRLGERAAFIPPPGWTCQRFRRPRVSRFTYEPELRPDSLATDQLVTRDEFDLSQQKYYRRHNMAGISLATLREWKTMGLTQFPDGLWGRLKA